MLILFEDKVTIYHFNADGSYKRIVLENVYWDESKKSNTTKSGMTNTDTVTVIIPTAENIQINEGKDLIVKGVCSFNENNQAIKKLCEDFNAKTIMIADEHLHGGLSNIELSCR